jgi:transposase
MLLAKKKQGRSAENQIELSLKDKRQLLEIIRGYSDPLLHFRACIILMAATGLSNTAIAKHLETSRDIVRKWRKRWCEWKPRYPSDRYRLRALESAVKGGAHRTIDAFIENELVSMVIHEKALKQEDQTGYIRRSVRDLHKELVEKFGELACSLSSCYRILKRRSLKPWNSQAWIHPRDPKFYELGAPLLDLYQQIKEGNLPEGTEALSLDETPIQAIERMCITPTSERHPLRYEFEYFRHGTVSMHAAFDLQTGQVQLRFPEASNSDEFKMFVRYLMSLEPYASARQVILIMDNGPCHHPSTFGEWLKEEFDGRVIVLHTPVHASWLNQIECFFSILMRKRLTPRDVPSCEALIETIERWVRDEYEPEPFQWRYTSSDLRKLLDNLKASGRMIIKRHGVKGVGKKIKANLIETFGSWKTVEEVSITELQKVRLVGPKLSKDIWDFFHPDPE